MKQIYLTLLLVNMLAELSSAQTTSLGKNVDELTKYIASEYFASLHSEADDIYLADSIYYKALEITDNSKSEALLALTFATIPYMEIPLQSPLLNIRINVPLPCSAESLFVLKNHNLPKNILPDSPENEFGDKDKLAHFFGSAYLSYISGLFDFTEIIGIFVEEFEESFYVQASADPRDIQADKLGNLFGKALKKNKNSLPSDILISHKKNYNKP